MAGDESETADPERGRDRERVPADTHIEQELLGRQRPDERDTRCDGQVETQMRAVGGRDSPASAPVGGGSDARGDAKNEEAVCQAAVDERPPERFRKEEIAVREEPGDESGPRSFEQHETERQPDEAVRGYRNRDDRPVGIREHDASFGAVPHKSDAHGRQASPASGAFIPAREKRLPMSPHAALTRMPFAEHLGIEVEHADGGEAVARLSLEPYHSSNRDADVAHGGVISSLADTVGAAAVMSQSGAVTPTIDLRIDYLAPATDDLRAEAHVLRTGDSLGVARVEIYAEDGENSHVATAHGTYKTDTDDAGKSPWTEGEGVYSDD